MFWDYSAEGVVGILVSLSLSTTVSFETLREEGVYG